MRPPSDDMPHSFPTLLRMTPSALALAAWLPGGGRRARAMPRWKLRLRRGQRIPAVHRNDILAGTDRYYTNGFKFGFGVPFETLRDFFKTPPSTRSTSFDSEVSHNFGLFLGQKFTLRATLRAAPQPYDRPWPHGCTWAASCSA